MLGNRLALDRVPDCAPCHFVSKRRSLGDQFVPVSAVREKRLCLFFEAGVLFRLYEVVCGTAHIGIKVSHLFDNCHRRVFLQLFPQLCVVHAILCRPEVFRINHGECSGDCRRLLNHDRKGRHNSRFLKLGHQHFCRILSRIASCAAVQILQELVNVIGCSLSVGILEEHIHGFFRIGFGNRRLEVVHPVKILHRQHERMVHTHLVHMICPYIHERSQNNGIAGFWNGIL